MSSDYELKQQLQSSCHSLVDGIDTAYGYKPSLAAGIVFCVLFGLSMLLHTAQFVWKRTWWCAVFSVGCLSMSLPTALLSTCCETDIFSIKPKS